MALTRRDFLKVGTVGGAAASVLGSDLAPAYAEMRALKIGRASETRSTCRSYIKTVDLTKNGLAVPEVDELAAIPLTLWADEKGYKKSSPNIFGL